MSDPQLKRYQVALREQFPALTIDSLEYLSEGWDSVACLVNHNLIFRFPKRPYVAHKLVVEARLLPELAGRLPLSIPHFIYLASNPKTAKSFPYIFVGYEMLKGISEEDWSPELEKAEWWKPPVGEFLTALHAFPIARARELGVRDMSLTEALSGDLVDGLSWRETLQAYFLLAREKAFPLLSLTPQVMVSNNFETFLADDHHFDFEPVVLHADLSEDHILIDLEQQKIGGIIDFGDVAIGDPALDVMESLLPYYGGKVDPTFVERRRFYLKHLPALTCILFGLEHNDPVLIEYGVEEINSFFV